MRPIPATNGGPYIERLRKGELSNKHLISTFAGFSKIMSQEWTEEQEHALYVALSYEFPGAEKDR